MKFTDLEQIMQNRGIDSLAEIARNLQTTPQAVSNWKARDQVPYHIVEKINNYNRISSQDRSHQLAELEETIKFSDILLTLAEQLKVIVIFPVITAFIMFTYLFSTNEPFYESSSKILLPENQPRSSFMGGFASQFGVDVQENITDLSSPSLFPELVKSYTFAERIMDEKFYVNEFGQELTLLAILTHKLEPPTAGRDTLIKSAMSSFQKMITFTNEGPFSLLTVRTNEPILARDINVKVLEELQELNRYYKSQNVSNKIRFIKNRIEVVGKELEESENKLKLFREQNRQILSPALQLEQEHLSRDVEIQKGVFLTLKQQFEMANIEKIQKEDVLQILDMPRVPLSGKGNDLKSGVIIASFLGLGLGVFFGFVRSHFKNSDKSERLKIRRMRNFINKKTKDIIFDRRISGIICLLLILGSPYYIGHESKNPIYFDMYSAKMMLMNIIYLCCFILSAAIFIYSSSRNNDKHKS
ncbi:MAG: hypothetical protein CMG74_12925 [Candidatus Marinimicrobia bacterium]|nr:hypothetical protein [Candidatus Neomarinimicrobiota bacterium]|tara:strand:+ start:1343 stop:2758 length:1416 start_codon:yes stop_codon:yes gene_type:complete